jgi:hypothetical protein
VVALDILAMRRWLMVNSKNEGQTVPVMRRFTALVRWLKIHPIITTISIVASIFAFISGILPTWETAMAISGRPACFSYGSIYYHSSGYFELSGNVWSEYPPYADNYSFEFEEVSRDREYIYLKNITPR